MMTVRNKLWHPTQEVMFLRLLRISNPWHGTIIPHCPTSNKRLERNFIETPLKQSCNPGRVGDVVYLVLRGVATAVATTFHRF